jgi:hypothetical protein
LEGIGIKEGDVLKLCLLRNGRPRFRFLPKLQVLQDLFDEQIFVDEGGDPHVAAMLGIEQRAVRASAVSFSIGGASGGFSSSPTR